MVFREFRVRSSICDTWR